MLSFMMWPRLAAIPSGLPERFSVTGTTWRYVTSSDLINWSVLRIKNSFCRCQTTLLLLSHKLRLKDKLRKRTLRATSFLRFLIQFNVTLHSMEEYIKTFSLSLQTSAAHGIWKMTFYTPEPVSMVLREAQQAGYSATSTSSRLVVRSPYNTAETYSEDVSNISHFPVTFFLPTI